MLTGVKNMARVCAIVLLFFGVAYALIIPPFQAPDEPAHFARAYGIAEGQFILRDHPPELVDFILSSLDNHYDVAAIPLLSDAKVLLESSNGRIPNIAYNTAQYSFVPYLVHAGIIKTVMIFVDYPENLLASLYLCRLSSVLIFCLCFLMAATIAPSYASLFFWVAATPMALSQGGMVSTDVFVFGAGLLLLCLGAAKVKIGLFLGLSLPLVFVLLITKPPYAPLILPAATMVLLSGDRKSGRLTGLAIAIALASIAGYIWKETILAHGIYAQTMEFIQTYRSPDISPAQQLSYLADNPLYFFSVIGNSIFYLGGNLFHQFVGVLGWQDLYLPKPAVYIWGLLLPVTLVAVKSDTDGHGPWQKRVMGFCLIGSGILTAVVIFAALYLIWMPVSAPMVEAQGRYFHLPVLAIALGFSVLLPKLPWNMPRTYLAGILIAAGIAINVWALTMIVDRYWLL